MRRKRVVDQKRLVTQRSPVKGYQDQESRCCEAFVRSQVNTSFLHLAIALSTFMRTHLQVLIYFITSSTWLALARFIPGIKRQLCGDEKILCICLKLHYEFILPASGRSNNFFFFSFLGGYFCMAVNK